MYMPEEFCARALCECICHPFHVLLRCVEQMQIAEEEVRDASSRSPRAMLWP